MSAPETTILSMEEVRRLTTIANNMMSFLERGPRGEAVTERTLARLCLTVEHWHREADEAAHVAAVQAEELDTLVDLGEERDRLRALVAGMRGKGWRLIKKLEEAAQAGDFLMDDSPVIAFRDCLADPDGQRAHDLAAKDREDAESWRALMEATDDQQDPEHVAFIEKATAAIAEGEEELRLLRDVEAARLCYEEALCHEGKFGLGECANRRCLMETKWKSLAAFRARQKGAPE